MPTPWQASPAQERDLELMNETEFIGPTMTEYFTWRMAEEWREKQDAKPIQLDTTLAAALAKAPWQWVDAARKTLSFPTKGRRQDKARQLSEHLTNAEHLRQVVHALKIEERLILKRVLDAGGWVKYATLVEEFGDQERDGWFWNEQPVVSSIGQVRMRALLFVGKAKAGGRGSTQVAVIPKDLREPLTQNLQDDLARFTQIEDYALQRTLQDIATHYKKNAKTVRIPRAWIEEFAREAAAGKRDIFGEWQDLQRFDYYIFRQQIASPAHIIGYHLSEFVHSFLPRKYIGEFWLPAKRRMLNTIATFYNFAAAKGFIETEAARRVAEAVQTITAGKGELEIIPTPPPLGGELFLIADDGTEQTQITFNDRWLTIVCAIEFKSNWVNLRDAATRVTDSETKLRLIDRLVRFGPPVWEALMRDVEDDEIEQARHWFQNDQVLFASAW